MSEISELHKIRPRSNNKGTKKLAPGIQTAYKLTKRPTSANEAKFHYKYDASVVSDEDIRKAKAKAKGGPTNKTRIRTPKGTENVKKTIKGYVGARSDDLNQNSGPNNNKSGSSTISSNGQKPAEYCKSNLTLLIQQSPSPPPQSTLQKTKSDESTIHGTKVTKVVNGDKQRPKTVTADMISTHYPHNASSFAKSAAESVTGVKTRTKKSGMKTQVVLAPRFAPESSEPSILTILAADENTKGNSSVASSSLRISPGKVWTKPSSSFVLNPSNNFPPEKARWVQMALEKLGKTWVSSGAVPHYMMDFSGFQKKIGDLYDKALNKKYNHINNVLTDTVFQETTKRTGKKNSNTGAPKTPVIMDDDSDDLQKKFSDILLQMLLQRMIPEIDGGGNKDASTNTNPINQRNIKFGRNNHEGKDSRKSNKMLEPMSLGDGHLLWGIQTVDPDAEIPHEVKNCFVFEGKICPVESNQKPDSSFAPLSESRKKKEPDTTTYFRKVADFRGFETDQISIKYSKTRIFIEGKKTQKEEQNYRLVREIISLPTKIKIDDLKVMRARNNGRIIFEEIVKPHWTD